MGNVVGNVAALARGIHRTKHYFSTFHRYEMPKAAISVSQLSLQMEKGEVGIWMVFLATNRSEISGVSFQQTGGILDPVFVQRATSRNIQNGQKHTNLVRTCPIDPQGRQLFLVCIKTHLSHQIASVLKEGHHRRTMDRMCN